VAAVDAGVPTPRASARRAAKPPLNVLLLSVDSLRADMPWAGYPREIAPNLTRLARESAVWTNYRSTSSYTAQSVATLLSGRYTSSLYRSGVFFTAFSPANLFFPELLQERGIRTIGLHAHMYFARNKGLEQGFDVWETVPGIAFDAETDRSVTSQKSSERLMALLSQPENTSGQFFVWAHYMDPHDQYIKHAESPDWGNTNRDRYDSEVFYTDLWLGKFLEFARAQPWWSRTAVIVTGDHGEAFGEHQMYKHAFELWDVLTRVPLIGWGRGCPSRSPARASRARCMGKPRRGASRSCWSCARTATIPRGAR
jgi:choline-sulfatase